VFTRCDYETVADHQFGSSFVTLNHMALIHILDFAARDRGCGVLGEFLFNWV